MLSDIDRLGPEVVLAVAAGIIFLADLVINERQRRWLPFGALAGVGLAALWALTLVLRERQGTAFQGTLSLDAFSLFFVFLFAGIVALVVVASMDYVRERLPAHQGEFFGLVLLASAGMMLLASSRDLIAIFVALELTSISQYILAGFLRTDRSSEAGLKYLLLGSMASAVTLYGMAFLFGITGTTKLVAPDGGVSIASVIAGGANGVDFEPALLMAIVFIAAGFGFKMAVIPFQMWTPDVYEGAPTPVAAFLSVGSKAAAFAVVLRIFYEGVGSRSFIGDDWSTLFAIIAAITMTLGNVMALLQTNIKRLLGYSSIAQAGNFMVGLAAISAGDGSLGPEAVVFFLATYVFTNLGAFFAVLAISDRINSDEISDYAGMARRAPWLALALAFCLVSLTGIPPTAGFVAKVFIFNAGVQSDLVWLVIIGVLNTVVSAFYYLRVVRQMYVVPAEREEPVLAAKPLYLALGIATAGVLVLGVYPVPLIDAAHRAAAIFGG